MAKVFYRTHHNYKPGTGQETNLEPSQTVPGQAHTMREILARYKNGMETERPRVEYFDVEDIHEINHFFAPGHLDLTDLDALKANVDNLGAMVKQAQQRAANIKEQKEKEEALRQQEMFEKRNQVSPSDKPDE